MCIVTHRYLLLDNLKNCELHWMIIVESIEISISVEFDSNIFLALIYVSPVKHVNYYYLLFLLPDGVDMKSKKIYHLN